MTRRISQKLDLTELQALDKDQVISMLVQLHEQFELMSAQFQALVNRVFRTGPERVDPNQLYLFDLGQQTPVNPSPPPSPESAAPTPRRPSTGHGRSQFPQELPRRESIIDVPEAERSCSTCGSEMAVIGEEVSERGDIIPAQFVVTRTIRRKRACPKGHGVAVAPLPPAVIDKSKYGPTVYAHVVTAKYGDHLPLHRISGMFRRHGMDLSKSTMWDMVWRVAELVAEPILRQMRLEILQERILQGDDTPVTVRLEEGKGAKKAYIWVYLAKQKIVFDFTLTRERDGPLQFLGTWTGVFLADGYAGFDPVVQRNGIERAGCWSHARRKLLEAWETGAGDAALLVRLVNRLFTIERALAGRQEARSLPPGRFEELRLRIRQKRSQSVLGRIQSELDRLWTSRLATPRSLLGKALGYLEKQWISLTRFLQHGALDIHNNAAERALRTVALGRNNWMVLGSPRGGRAACQIYSLILSCKAIGVNPEAYILDLLSRISTTQATDIASLTPWAWAQARNAAIAASVD